MPLNVANQSLKGTLTVRYIVALVLIFCVLLGSYSVLQRQITLNKQDAYIINISGMQRMLSQRISLLVVKIYHANSEGKAKEYAGKLRLVADRMADNQTQLTTGFLSDQREYELSPRIKDMYFGQNDLKARVDQYLADTFEFLYVFEAQGIAGVRAQYDAKNLKGIADSGALLDDLNDVVTEYQVEAERKIMLFSHTESVVFLVGVFLLIGEVFFIFRPMVAQIVQSMAALKKANAELIEFSYRISHDLRAPAVSSKALIDLAKDALKKGDTGFVETALGHIHVSMVRLEALVDDILNLNKMKLVDAEVREFALLPMVEEIQNSLAHIEGADKIEFRNDINIQAPLVMKEVFMRQSLENLISNAIKYMDTSKENPFISVRAEMKGGICEITVTDNGIGIPEDYRNQVFDMFKRFHPKVASGSGLGLYLVQQNMHALNGEVVYTPLPDGSEFKLVFPIEA